LKVSLEYCRVDVHEAAERPADRVVNENRSAGEILADGFDRCIELRHVGDVARIPTARPGFLLEQASRSRSRASIATA